MPRRNGARPGKSRYPCRLSARVSRETIDAIDSYIAANPTLGLNKSEVIDQALAAFFKRQNYWTDIAVRLDHIKRDLLINRRNQEKGMEILLHFVRGFFCHVDGVPSREAMEQGERFYRGFVSALNKLLKTHSYVAQLYTEDFDAALQEHAEAATARAKRALEAEAQGPDLRVSNTR